MSKIDELLKDEKVEWKKLGEIGYFFGGLTGKTKEDFGTGNSKYVPYKNIFSNIEVDLNNLESVNIGNEKQNELRIGDILFTGSSEIMEECGLSSVITEEISGIYLNSFSFAFRLNDDVKILPSFSKYLFRDFRIRKQIIKTANGVTRFNVSKEAMKKIEIPIPSIETQEKIVKTLDKFTNYVTELQAELQARTKQYEYYRDMLLSEDYLNKISEELLIKYNSSLKKNKLIYISEITRGKRLVRSELKETGKFPVFQNSLTPLGYYHDKNFTGGKTCVISAGAAGDIFYIEDDFWAADDVFVITGDSILNKYIYYFLLSKQNLIKSKVRKASVPRLSRDEIEKIEILVPAIGLQEKIVEILDKFQSLLTDTKGLLPQEIEQREKQYEYYREKLLTFTTEDKIISRQTDRQTDRQVISSEYFVLLKEAADIVGVKLFDIKRERLGNCVLNVEKIKWNDSQESSFNYIDLSSVDRENHSISNLDIITMKNAPSRAQQVVYTDDVLFGTTRPLLQRYCIIPDQYDEQICSTGFCVLRANKEKVLSKWILYGISTSSFLSHIEKYEKGTSYPAISDKDIKLYEIPLPSIPVQKYIVSILDKFDTLVNDISKGLPKEIELRQNQYEYYREKLLGFK